MLINYIPADLIIIFNGLGTIYIWVRLIIIFLHTSQKDNLKTFYATKP